MGEWKYSSTRSYPRLLIEVIGQIYAPAVLPRRKVPPLPATQKADETQNGCARFVGQIYLVTIPRLETLLFGMSSLYPAHCTYELC
jgi:hypothetical protein